MDPVIIMDCLFVLKVSSPSPTINTQGYFFGNLKSLKGGNSKKKIIRLLQELNSTTSSFTSLNEVTDECVLFKEIKILNQRQTTKFL